MDSAATTTRPTLVGPLPKFPKVRCDSCGQIYVSTVVIVVPTTKPCPNCGGGCFEAALHAVQTYGGVLEHPAYSKAWDRFNLPKPNVHEGWTLGLDGGASCYVEQRRYGMVTKKPTWLYAFGVDLPELLWGFEPDSANRFNSTVRLEDGRRSGIAAFRDRDGNGQTIHTPVAFRDLLLDMARSAQIEVAA